MSKYVAFLRGINLGKRNVKMDELRKAFADLGLENAQTLIASGNVLFDSAKSPDVAKIEKGLENHFGFAIGTVIRSIVQLQDLIDSAPFADYDPELDVKYYVSFAAGPIGGRLDEAASVPDDFDLVRVDDKEFFAVAYRKPDGRYGSSMIVLEKRFKDLTITSRNWNTVQRMVAKAEKS